MYVQRGALAQITKGNTETDNPIQPLSVGVTTGKNEARYHYLALCSLNITCSALGLFVIVADPAMGLELLHLIGGQALAVTHHHVALDIAQTTHARDHS